MKFLFVLTAVFASASAQAIVAGVATTGSSAVSRSEDGLGNYAFGYNEDHAFGGTFRKEKGGPGVQVGSYGLREADGRMRVVNYVADALGFRASISSNEPGVDIAKDPAAVSMNAGHVAAPVAVAAPAVMAPAATTVVAKSMMATPVVAKAFDAPLIKAYDPFVAKAAVAVAAPIAHSYHTTTKHVAAPLIAKTFAQPLLAKSFVF